MSFEFVDLADEVRKAFEAGGHSIDASQPRRFAMRPQSAPSAGRHLAARAASRRWPPTFAHKKLQIDSVGCSSEDSTRPPSPEAPQRRSDSRQRLKIPDGGSCTDSAAPSERSSRSSSCVSQASALGHSASAGDVPLGQQRSGLVSRLQGEVERCRAKESRRVPSACNSSRSGSEAQAAEQGDDKSRRRRRAYCKPPIPRESFPRRDLTPKEKETPKVPAALNERLWSVTVLQSIAADRKAGRQKTCPLKLRAQVKALDSPPAVTEELTPIERLSPWRKVNCGELPSPMRSLARRTFASYDVDGDGRLGFGEFGSLLRDTGLDVDYAKACQAVELIAGPGERSFGFDTFSRLLAADVKKHVGYTNEAVASLRYSFSKYNRNGSGKLDVLEYSRFLEDLGYVPHTKEESQKLGDIIASCREDGKPGALDFESFMKLVAVLGCNEHDLP